MTNQLQTAHNAILNLPRVDAVELRFEQYFADATSVPERTAARKKRKHFWQPYQMKHSEQNTPNSPRNTAIKKEK